MEEFMLKKEEIDKAKKLRLMDLKAKKLLREIIIYGIYLVFLFLVLSNNINPNYYNYQDKLTNIFVKSGFEDVILAYVN
jgi:hypothetical protein